MRSWVATSPWFSALVRPMRRGMSASVPNAAPQPVQIKDWGLTVDTAPVDTAPVDTPPANVPRQSGHRRNSQTDAALRAATELPRGRGGTCSTVTSRPPAPVRGALVYPTGGRSGFYAGPS